MPDEFKDDHGSTIEDGVAEDNAKQACALCLNEFKKSALTPFDFNKDGRESPLCNTCLSKVNGTFQNPQGSSPAIYTSTAGGGDTNRSIRCTQYLLFIGIACLGIFIIFGVRYFRTLKWESVEGTISEPCVVDYEIDGQSYTHTTKFNCEELGPYKLKYNPQNPDEAISAGLQDQDKIMLIVLGCLTFGIPYIIIVTYLCRRYDVPLLKRIFRRS